MPLSLQDPVLGKRRFFHAAIVSGGAAAHLLAVEFFKWLNTQGGKPTLQVVEFAALSNTDTVIADAACKLYALILHKATATASFTKVTDSATTSVTDGTQDLSIGKADVNTDVFFWPKGRAFANGITMRGNTTATGNTTSGANGADGVALLGAA